MAWHALSAQQTRGLCRMRREDGGGLVLPCFLAQRVLHHVELDEEVARLHLEKLGVKLTKDRVYAAVTDLGGRILALHEEVMTSTVPEEAEKVSETGLAVVTYSSMTARRIA